MPSKKKKKQKEVNWCNRWNVILMILAILIVIDAAIVLSRDFDYEQERAQMMREAGIQPQRLQRNNPRAKVHVKLPREVVEKKKFNIIGKKHRNKMIEEGGGEDSVERHIGEESTEEGNGTDNESVVEGAGEDPEGTSDEPPLHKIAGLNCDRFGGPSEEDAAEMIYWEDIPDDAEYTSPLREAGPDPKYLTFEPDEGGWNNIRMSMETAVTMAHALGRTLVLPPEQGMYLLHKDEGGKQKNAFSFADFFHFDSVNTEHLGFDIISFDEFVKREIETNNLRNKHGTAVRLPRGRTHFNGVTREEAKQLDQWMRTFTNHPIWSFDSCMVGIPAKPGPVEHLKKIAEEVLSIEHDKRRKMYYGNPTPVDASPFDRLKESIAHRSRLCLYDESFQNSKVIHLMGDNASGARLLVHFYAFLFFEDWKSDLWTKRFVRDHLRYVDEIQCAAARVVKAMRQKAREWGQADGNFDTMHIRRGDFQYKDTRIPADQIFLNTKDLIPPNTTVYIATDERDKSFFDVFRKNYNVFFLDDFKHELKELNTNFYGMLDQRVASRGKTFVGCYYSTFTGYINRMRGYHSQKEKAEGHEQGALNSYYYIPNAKRDAVRQYMPIAPAMWSREFPIGWRDLDKGIDELHQEYVHREKAGEAEAAAS